MASRLKTSQRFLPQRFHFNIMYRYPVSFNNGASSIGFSFIFSGLFFSRPGASLLDYVLFSVWSSTIQNNSPEEWKNQKNERRTKIQHNFALRPIPFLSSLFCFSSCSIHRALAVAVAQPCFFPFPFSFCFPFSLPSVSAFFLFLGCCLHPTNRRATPRLRGYPLRMNSKKGLLNAHPDMENV